MMFRQGRAAVALCTLAMLFAASAEADTTDILAPQHNPPNAFDGWLAGPCTGDQPTCTPETPGLFFKTAGGHPPIGFVQFIVQHEVIQPETTEPLIEPIRRRVPRTLKVDLPPGLVVNPQAAPRCSQTDFFHVAESGPLIGAPQPLCSPATKIGEVQVKVVTGEPGFLGNELGHVLLPGVPGFTNVDLFNIEPFSGEPALLGFVLANAFRGFLHADVAWESDYHASFILPGLPDYKTLDIPGIGRAPVGILSARLINFGRSGDGTFATLPTTCFDPNSEPQFQHLYSSWIRQDSHAVPDPAFPLGSSAVEAPLPAGVHPEECGSIPFQPSIEVDPGTSAVDSPASPSVTTRLRVETPKGGGGPIAQSHLRTAEVKLPAGMGLNPAGSDGLIACADQEFHKGDRTVSEPNYCPQGSFVGTAEIKTPLLPVALKGNVSVGVPKSTDPSSGEEFRIFIEALSMEYDVFVRLIGNVKADPKTGQLTAVFDEQEVGEFSGALPHGLPQVPVESITLRFDRPNQVFSSPPTCSASTTTSVMEPWARPGTHVSSVADFILSSLPNSSAPCPETLAERPFVPVFTAKTDDSRAGAFSPLRAHLGRSDGQQEVKLLDATLPKGLIGKLAGVPYCSEEDIAAATSKSGAAERTSPSCPAASMVGTSSTESGTGPTPLKLPGSVYLAGPYHGAPLSLALMTPAISGPFDLGNVVVRAALNIDPTSAQIHVVSDVIPDVFGGVKLDLRSVDLNLDRDGFMVNPTNCSAQSTSGAISGGGADPTDPAAFSSFGFESPFQATGCNGLGFAPRLTTTLSGPKKRGGFPRLTATLNTRPGDANVASVAVTLPKALFVAQEHISTVCTRPDLATNTCPTSSVYGEAEADSPLLDAPLKGNVYLVPGGHQLPDLVADLRGQVNIQLHGVISSERGRTKTTFGSVPDVAVKSFVLRLAGGKKGLIVNSKNICKAKRLAKLNIKAQNGKQLSTNKYKLKLPGCKKRKKHRRH